MHVAAGDWCHDHVESAFIGYVCIAYMNPLVGDCLCVYRAFSVGWCMFGMCISLAPVIYIYTFILW